MTVEKGMLKTVSDDPLLFQNSSSEKKKMRESDFYGRTLNELDMVVVRYASVDYRKQRQ